MNRLKKPKALPKCECGETVALGSVFCVQCKDHIQKKNAKMIKKAEQKYEKNIGKKGKKK